MHDDGASEDEFRILYDKIAPVDIASIRLEANSAFEWIRRVEHGSAWHFDVRANGCVRMNVGADELPNYMKVACGDNASASIVVAASRVLN